MFSRISVYLRRHDAYDFNMMGQNAAQVNWKEGYPPVITGHLDTVCNFSDWVAPHLASGSWCEGVTKFMCFRAFRKAGTQGEAVIQQKEWPGERAMYSGLQPHTNYTRVFKDVHCPQIQLGDIPQAQRRDPWDDDMKTKVEKGIRKVQDLVNVEQVHIDNLQVEIDACCADVSVSQGCTWNPTQHHALFPSPSTLQEIREKCRLVRAGLHYLGPNAAADAQRQDDSCAEAYALEDIGTVNLDILAENVAAGDAALVEQQRIEEQVDQPIRNVSKGEFYLIKPNEDDNNLYNVGEVKGLDKLNGYPAVYILYWEYEQVWGPMRPRTAYRRVTDLDLVYVEALTDKLKKLVTAKGHNGNRSKAKAFRFHADDVQMVRNWVELWGDMDQHGGNEYRDTELEQA